MVLTDTNRSFLITPPKRISMWEVIAEFHQGYSWDENVTLSNDCSVVLEVLDSKDDVNDYLSLPECEREYSNAPFENVAQYVDINDRDAVANLQASIDIKLFEQACSESELLFG